MVKRVREESSESEFEESDSGSEYTLTSESEYETDYSDSSPVNDKLNKINEKLSYLVYINDEDDTDMDTADTNIETFINNNTKSIEDKQKVQEYISLLNDKTVNYNLLENVIISNLADTTKKNVLQKLYKYSTQNESSDDKQKYNNYVHELLRIPINKFKSVNYPAVYNNIKTDLNTRIYGMENVKEELIEYVSKLKITNDGCTSLPILALQGPPGVGKCLAYDTDLILYDGRVCKVQNIKINDRLMGPDSTPRIVKSLASGVELMYTVTDIYTNEIVYTVNESHILSLFDIHDNTIKNLSIREYLDYPYKANLRGYRVPLVFESTEDVPDITDISDITIDILNKYKTQSISQRTKIIDILTTSVQKYNEVDDSYYIFFRNEQLLDGFLFIARSLGHVCQKIRVNPTKATTNALYKRSSYIDLVPMFKLIISRDMYKYTVYPITVCPTKEDAYYGFEIDGDRLFVLGDFSVSHNTTIAKCFSEMLDLPFNHLSIGCITDINVLTGHNYTYVGSTYGRIYDSLIKSECMNPIIYLDEIDKIEDSSKHISNFLIHLLDTTQNTSYQDMYFGNDITLDLSNVLFITSFNNIENIDPILRNRMNVIKIPEQTLHEKTYIAKHIILPSLFQKLKFDMYISRLMISDENIEYIINNKIDADTGMRFLKNSIERICSKILTTFVLYETKDSQDTLDHLCNKYIYSKLHALIGGLKDVDISKKLIDLILPDINAGINKDYLNMYI